MDAGETHILMAWSERRTPGATDSALLACSERVLERANPADRVLLIADDHGERRAAALGLCTPLVVPPAAIRWPRFAGGLARALARTARTARLVAWEDRLLRKARGLSPWGDSTETIDGRVPGVLPRRLPSGDRASIRAALGLGPNEHVLALAADPPDALSAQDFIRACALVALVGRDVTAIVPRQAPEMERAKATLRTTGIPLRLLTCEAPIWTVLPCADAVVVDVLEGSVPRATPAHSRAWMAATCAGLGVPVAWTDAELFGVPKIDGRLLRPRSRLAVHVARAINEHFLAADALSLAPTTAQHEVVA